MTSLIFQTVAQSIASTLHWLGFYIGARNLPGSDRRRSAWIFGSAVLAIAWFLAALLLASSNYFSDEAFPLRVPIALGLSLALGYLLPLSRDFRAIIAAVAPHWLIGVQVFRILGAAFLVRWWQGDLRALFAIPAGVGDTLTGLCAPPVAYWWYTRKSYARSAAIAWNLFGMADLVVAVALGASVQGPGLAFPTVMIPIYAVPRSFLIHCYSLVGLFRSTSEQPTAAKVADARAGA